MTLNGSIHRALGALGLLSGALAGCTLDVAGTGASAPAETTAWEAGVNQAPPEEHRDAGAQQETGACTQPRTKLELSLETPASTVLILLDRSSSMFEFGYWEPVKSSVLEAVSRFEREVRFGLATYTGERDHQCPALELSAELGRNNAEDLRRAYDHLQPPAFKGETPTAAALSQVAQMLARERHPGAKFILLITDGDPDFCNDGPSTCARDAVVAAAQAAYAQGITTLVFRIGDQVTTDHLTDVANAGSGQPVAQRDRAYEACPASGAVYAEAGGDAQFHAIAPAEPDAPSALVSAIAGTRSCVFELRGRNRLDASAAEGMSVEIDGQQMVHGDPDGFRMNGPTQLELLGASCQRWRAPGARLSFVLPCGS